MTDHRLTGGTGGTDEADTLAVLARLAAHGATPAAVAVNDGEVLIETPPTTTPAQGMALLRAAEDDPADGVRVERSPGYADLLARVAGRRVRLRVLLRTRAMPRQRRGGGS